MPVMMRKKGKAKKIALSILGKPSNEESKKLKSSSKKRKVNKEIEFQESALVR